MIQGQLDCRPISLHHVTDLYDLCHTYYVTQLTLFKSSLLSVVDFFDRVEKSGMTDRMTRAPEHLTRGHEAAKHVLLHAASAQRRNQRWRKNWCRHQDSNPGPTDYKSVALPTELYRPCPTSRQRANSTITYGDLGIPGLPFGRDRGRRRHGQSRSTGKTPSGSSKESAPIMGKEAFTSIQ